jgi:hypothetical protein
MFVSIFTVEVRHFFHLLPPKCWQQYISLHGVTSQKYYHRENTSFHKFIFYISCRPYIGIWTPQFTINWWCHITLQSFSLLYRLFGSHLGIAPCRNCKKYQHFGGICCLLLMVDVANYSAGEYRNLIPLFHNCL